MEGVRVRIDRLHVEEAGVLFFGAIGTVLQGVLLAPRTSDPV